MLDLKISITESLYAYFQRRDKRPPIWYEPLLFFGPEGKLTRSRHLAKRLWALRLPISPLGESSDIPIEVLIVVAPKDFNILPFSIEGAIRNAGHPISRLVLIVPNNSIEKAWGILSPWSAIVECEVVGEDSVISESTRRALRKSFTNRYGWILQQLLCLAFVAKSEAAGVLLLDSDTILVSKRALFNAERQILMVSLERHEPYYKFLNSLNSIFGEMENTFVTHHMVQNPQRMREILDVTCDGDMEQLADEIISLVDHEQISSVCVDFELYAQAMCNSYSNQVVLTKWSNISVPRAEALSGVTFDQIQKRYHNYCSVSFHSYT